MTYQRVTEQERTPTCRWRQAGETPLPLCRAIFSDWAKCRAPELNGSGFSESAMNWRVWPRVVVEAAGSGIDTGLPALAPGWSGSPPPQKGRLLATVQ